MRAERVSFYVYAESAEKAAELEHELHDLVASMYQQGTIVRAERLTALLRRYKDNPLLPMILKNG